MKAALHAASAMARGPLWPLLAVSGVCWAAMAALVLAAPLVRICGGAARWAPLAPAIGWGGPDPHLVFDWLMLGAMMSPLVAHNLACVLRQSLADRKGRAAGLFILGYLAPWTAALTALTVLAGLLARTLGDLAALSVVVGLGLLWQGAPLKGLALRGCHRTPSLPTFGARAEVASLAYGAKTGAWCVAACWLWMLAPLTWAAGHLWLSLAAFLVMLAERYGRPPPVRLRPTFIATGAAVVFLATSFRG